jgi:PAS domain S-box-containing protein
MSGLIVSESVRYPYLSSLYEQINDTCFQKNLGRSYREGRICAITDVDAAGLSDCHLKLLQEFQVQANLVVPVILSASHADLMTENALWGLLVAHQCDRPRQWQTEEIELLQKMSVQLALAVQHNLAYYHLRLQKSKRNQVELNLQESEQKYLSLVRSLPVGVFRTDVDGHCLYVNDRWCQIAGLGVEAAAGFGWIASLHPDDCQLVVDEWYASTEAERPFSLEYRFVNAEGNRRNSRNCPKRARFQPPSEDTALGAIQYPRRYANGNGEWGHNYLWLARPRRRNTSQIFYFSNL